MARGKGSKGGDYKIKKIEKGPLQRFKNQNLIVKKFGEAGLKVYKAITGNRTTKELRKDLDLEQGNFDEIIDYMSDAGIIELEPIGKAKKPTKKKARKLEEISPEEELEPEGEEAPPLEEEPVEKTKETITEEEPEETFEPEGEGEEEEPKKKSKGEEEITFEEITPIDFEETEEAPKEKKPSHKKRKKEVEPTEEEEEIKPTEEEEEIEPTEEEEEIKPTEEEEEIGPTEEEFNVGSEEEESKEEEPELSPVEKIISDKYGDVGLKVYALIDGQRTAEEIMKETGLTEPKLVEILDFMDAQGIIKLDYSKKGGTGESPFAPASTQQFPEESETSTAKKTPLSPIIEEEGHLEEARGILSPVEIPIKAPLDIVKSVQFKARLMLKFPKNLGGKVFDLINGKHDILEIALKLDVPLYELDEILKFMLDNGSIILKPMSRTDIRKKYGDDGYAVYKKFGKEGLMLYELIGKEMTIRQMADKVTKDRLKVVDMFIFIHKVLGIELPIDRDMLAKQLGL